MGLKITITNADYSTPIEVIPDFTRRSDGAISFAYFHSLNSLSFKSSLAGNYEFVITNFVTGVTSCKLTVPSSNAVPLHALCIGTDVSGNAIVLYFDNSGFVRLFPKNGITTGIATLTSFAAPKPNCLKGVAVTITHGTTSFNISYTGYSRTFNYSDIPQLVHKGFGFLATNAAMQSYTFEVLG